jgi:DNA-binding transcriptional LysR family regulator
MRGLDSALDAARGQLDSGVVRLAAPAAFVPIYLLPAVSRLRGAHPGLQPAITVTGAAEAKRALLDGTLDLGLFEDPAGDPELLVERLHALRFGVYCGPGHPLYRRRRARLASLAEYPFVVCTGDRWPRHLPRRIGLELSEVTLAREACARGDFLTVLANVVAEAHPVRLRRLPIDVVPGSALCTIRRRPHDIATPADLVLRALRG